MTIRDSIKASVNDDDSYVNNSMLALTFTTSLTADCCYRGMKMIYGPVNSRPFFHPPPFFCLSLLGNDVSGGEEAGPQGPGST